MTLQLVGGVLLGIGAGSLATGLGYQGVTMLGVAFLIAGVALLIVSIVQVVTEMVNSTVTCRAVSPQPVQTKIPEFGVQSVIYFEDFWVVEGMNKQSFSQSGDSGSLVCLRPTQGAPSAVGLLFAGNAGSALTFVAPLDKILNRLGVSIVSGHHI